MTPTNAAGQEYLNPPVAGTDPIIEAAIYSFLYKNGRLMLNRGRMDMRMTAYHPSTELIKALRLTYGGAIYAPQGRITISSRRELLRLMRNMRTWNVPLWLKEWRLPELAAAQTYLELRGRWHPRAQAHNSPPPELKQAADAYIHAKKAVWG